VNLARRAQARHGLFDDARRQTGIEEAADLRYADEAFVVVAVSVVEALGNDEALLLLVAQHTCGRVGGLLLPKCDQAMP
jgi:hypothetical protein